MRRMRLVILSNFGFRYPISGKRPGVALQAACMRDYFDVCGSDLSDTSASELKSGLGEIDVVLLHRRTSLSSFLFLSARCSREVPPLNVQSSWNAWLTTPHLSKDQYSNRSKAQNGTQKAILREQAA